MNTTFHPGSQNQPDIDSIRIALSIEELISFFPPATLGRLYSKRGTSTALYQWVLVTEAAGYDLYAKLTTEQKRDACLFISNHGPLVHPSRHGRVFSTGTISVPLNVTLSALLYARCDVCVIEAFGMKMDLAMLEQLAEMQVNETNLVERVDIGISAYCSGIPLFNCTNRGQVHPLLYMAGFGNGSVSVKRDIDDETSVRTVVYPRLSHHIKSLLHISYDVPRTMSGLHRKRDPILRFLADIEDVEEEQLYGYRVELQFTGKVTLLAILRNPPITSAALPENVLCQYMVEKDVYVNLIVDYYTHVCRRGLFSGNAASPTTVSKQRLLAQLLNTFGLWVWKFASYVRRVEYRDLPPFMSAVMQVNSTTAFPRHGRITSNRLSDEVDARLLQSLEDVDQPTDLVAEIMDNIRTRRAPRNRSMICGFTHRGGMTRCFNSLRELAEFASATYGERWTETLVAFD